MSCKHLTIYTDGACSGNPGPAGIGVVLKDNDVTIKEISRFIGHSTNNIAEYSALVVALQEAQALGVSSIDVKTDSELMVKQVTGLYAVKHENIVPLFKQIKLLMLGFSKFTIVHVRRELNKEADKLSTDAIKNYLKNDGRPIVADKGEESPSSKG